jgi:hypothetical protein
MASFLLDPTVKLLLAYPQGPPSRPPRVIFLQIDIEGLGRVFAHQP